MFVRSGYLFLVVGLVIALGTLARGEDPGKSGSFVDRYGDPLPQGAIARLGTLRLGSKFDFGTIAFSPDGKTLASWNSDGNIRLWEVSSGKEIRRLAGRRDESAAHLVFSPDGKILAGGWPKAIWFWDPATGNVLRRIQGLPQSVSGPNHKCLVSVAFSKDGQTLLSAGMEGVASWWEVATGKRLQSWQLIDKNKDREESINSLVLSADGQTMALETEPRGGNDSPTLKILDTDRKKERSKLKAKKGWANFYTLSADGKLLARGEDGKDADGRWVPAAAVYDTATGKQVHLFTRGDTKESASITTFTFSSKNTLLAAHHCNGMVRIWSLANGKLFTELKTRTADDLDECELAFSPDGKMLALARPTNVRLFDTTTGKEFPAVEGHRGSPLFLQFSTDGRFLTSRSADAWCRWETATWKQANRYSLMTILDDHQEAVVSQDAIFISPKDEPRILARALDTRKEVREFPSCDAGFHDGCFSPDRRTLAFLTVGADSRVLHFWDVSNGKKAGQINLSDYAGLKYAFAPHGKTLAWTCNDRTVRLASFPEGKAKGQLGKPLPKPAAGVSHAQMIVFSPDSRFLALGEEGITVGDNTDISIRIWEIATGRELRQFQGCFGEGFSRRLVGLTFSADSKALACGLPRSSPADETRIRLLEMASGKERRHWDGHRRAIASLAFSPDGSRLASGSFDTTILIWGLTSPHGPEKASALKDFDALWNDLASQDAALAYQAIETLAQLPRQSVAFLRDRLEAIRDPNAGHVAQLIADLDSPSFTTRENAATELEKLLELVEPALRKALMEKPSPEVRRRVEGLLERVEIPVMATHKLRMLRAIEVLQYIGTSEAKLVLKTIAQGSPRAQVTREAKASLDYLARGRDDK